MTSVTPIQAFEKITNELGVRTIAVGLFRILTSRNPILILENEQQAQYYKIVMERFIQDALLMAPSASDSTPKLTVLSKDSYKRNWRKFSGKEICFVKEERTVKNPGVDLLMEILVEEHAKGFLTEKDSTEQVLEMIHEKIDRITTTVIQIRKIIEDIPKGQQRRGQMKKIMQQHLKSKKEKELVFHIFELLQGISLERGNIRRIEKELKEFKSHIGKKHPLYAFLSEHEQILSFLEVLDTIKAALPEGLTSEERDVLRSIAENFVEANKHYTREEEVLFQRLQSKGINGTPSVLKRDHERLESLKERFLKYAKNPEGNEEELIKLIDSLPYLLREHIFKENTILYPIAIEKLEDWDSILKEAKKIGFCQFQSL